MEQLHPTEENSSREESDSIFMYSNQHTPSVKMVSVCGVIYFNPSDTDERLRDLLYGKGKEQRNGESDCPIEGNSHKHSACRQLVSIQNVNTHSDEDDDLAGHKKRCHVQATQIGAFHDLGDFQSVQ